MYGASYYRASFYFNVSNVSFDYTFFFYTSSVAVRIQYVSEAVNTWSEIFPRLCHDRLINQLASKATSFAARPIIKAIHWLLVSIPTHIDI